MPQQLKQFVENSKKQKEYKNYEEENRLTEPDVTYNDGEIEFGKHFLFNTAVSSDESGKNEEKLESGENCGENVGENVAEDGNPVLDMSLHE